MYTILLLFVITSLQRPHPDCRVVHNSRTDSVTMSSALKRPKSSETDFEKCLICQTYKNDPLYKLTASGLDSFKSALNERRDDVYDRLCNFIQTEKTFLSRSPKCHKSCKSIYMLNRPDQILMAKRQKVIARGTDNSGEVSDFQSSCLICGKCRDSKGVRDMSTVSTKARSDAIYEKANELQDEFVLHNITDTNHNQIDLAMNKFQYHIVCLRFFMQKNSPDSIDEPSSYDKAFLQLVNDINDSLLKQNAVYSLSKLTAQYRQLLQELKIPQAITYRTHNMKKRLSAHFGDSIQFLNPKGITTLVCASNITLEHMCSEVLKLNQELEDSEMLTDTDSSDTNDIDSHNSNSHLYMSAKCLRGQIKDKARQQRKTSQMPDITDDCDKGCPSIDISKEYALNMIPTDLYNYLGWLLSDEDLTFKTDGRLNVSDTLHGNIINLAQDIMFNASYIATPKHVGLGLYLIKEFRSKALLTVLNRFGNTISVM